MSGPILVFDSGIGGLSVFSEIHKQLPQSDYCYLFDNARLPYGNLTEEELVEGCVSLIVKQVANIKASIVVVACNTASTLVLPTLREKLTIPVVGVVPAVKPAVAMSVNKHIGLLATPGTVKREYTSELISQFADGCKVDLFGTSELVLIAEQYAAREPIDMAALKHILKPVSESSLDVLVLGCTHFPMIAEQIKQCIGANVTLLDSGEAVANRVKDLLNISEDGNAQLQACFTKQISDGLKLTLADYGFHDLTLIS